MSHLVTLRRVVKSIPSSMRTAQDCGGVGAGATGDRAAGAADRADHGTKKGAFAQALHRRPPRRNPKTNRNRPRAGELESGRTWKTRYENFERLFAAMARLRVRAGGRLVCSSLRMSERGPELLTRVLVHRVHRSRKSARRSKVKLF